MTVKNYTTNRQLLFQQADQKLPPTLIDTYNLHLSRSQTINRNLETQTHSVKFHHHSHYLRKRNIKLEHMNTKPNTFGVITNRLGLKKFQGHFETII